MHAEQWAKACVQTKAAGHSAAMRRRAGRRARGRNRTPEIASAGFLSGLGWRGFCERFASPRAIRAPNRHQPRPGPGRRAWLAAGASLGCRRRQGRCATAATEGGQGIRGGRKRSGWKASPHSGAPAPTGGATVKIASISASRIAAGKPAYLDWREVRRRLLPWPAGISLLAEGARHARMVARCESKHGCAIPLP